MTTQTHDFLPINTPDHLELAKLYVANAAAQLAVAVLGRPLPVDTICFFAHSSQEYDFLLHAVHSSGPESRFTHGKTTYADVDWMIGAHHITIFGVRQPEENRPEFGYGDYPVSDYAALVDATHEMPNVRHIISGRGQPLIELSHPDFDVRGYVADAAEHAA